MEETINKLTWTLIAQGAVVFMLIYWVFDLRIRVRSLEKKEARRDGKLQNRTLGY